MERKGGIKKDVDHDWSWMDVIKYNVKSIMWQIDANKV